MGQALWTVDACFCTRGGIIESAHFASLSPQDSIDQRMSLG